MFNRGAFFLISFSKLVSPPSRDHYQSGRVVLCSVPPSSTVSDGIARLEKKCGLPTSACKSSQMAMID